MSEHSHAPSQHSALPARAWSSPASGWCTPPPQTSASHPLTWQAQDRSGVASAGGRSRQRKPSPLKRHQATHRALPSSVNLLYGKFRPAMTCRSDKHRVRHSGAARRITHMGGCANTTTLHALPAALSARARTHVQELLSDRAGGAHNRDVGPVLGQLGDRGAASRAAASSDPWGCSAVQLCPAQRVACRQHGGGCALAGGTCVGCAQGVRYILGRDVADCERQAAGMVKTACPSHALAACAAWAAARCGNDHSLRSETYTPSPRSPPVGDSCAAEFQAVRGTS